MKGTAFPQFSHLGGQKSYGALVTGRGDALTRGTALLKMSHLGSQSFRELSSPEVRFALTRGTAYSNLAALGPNSGSRHHHRGFALTKGTALLKFIAEALVTGGVGTDEGCCCNCNFEATIPGAAALFPSKLLCQYEPPSAGEGSWNFDLVTLLVTGAGIWTKHPEFQEFKKQYREPLVSANPLPVTRVGILPP